MENKKESPNILALTIYGKTKCNKGFVVDLTEEEVESLKYFLCALHGGSIRVLEVDNLVLTPTKDFIKKEVKDE